jgi:hypothetical protein
MLLSGGAVVVSSYTFPRMSQFGQAATLCVISVLGVLLFLMAWVLHQSEVVAAEISGKRVLELASVGGDEDAGQLLVGNPVAAADEPVVGIEEIAGALSEQQRSVV